MWGAVPRVWEKLKAALEAGFAAEPDEQRRAAVAAALELAIGVVRAEQAGEQVAPELRRGPRRGPTRRSSRDCASSSVSIAVEYLSSGAAPIAPEVLEFFAALGLPICELWGMTELSLIATMNPRRRDPHRHGRVALPGLELSLADDGELLVRGPTVMRGYRGDPERTAETIDADGLAAHRGHRGDRRGRVRARSSTARRS